MVLSGSCASKSMDKTKDKSPYLYKIRGKALSQGQN